MSFLEWIVVGLIAGWLAGQVMKGGGYGRFVDILLGIVGGVLGGWIFGMLGIWPAGGIIGSLIVAFIGAVILVAITRVIKRRLDLSHREKQGAAANFWRPFSLHITCYKKPMRSTGLRAPARAHQMATRFSPGHPLAGDEGPHRGAPQRDCSRAVACRNRRLGSRASRQTFLPASGGGPKWT